MHVISLSNWDNWDATGTSYLFIIITLVLVVLVVLVKSKKIVEKKYFMEIMASSGNKNFPQGISKKNWDNWDNWDISSVIG